MITSLHVASGAAAGAAAGSRRAALVLGPLLHAFGDRVPHEDIRSRRFEMSSGIGALLLVAAARGPLHPSTIGAAAAAAPDIEHVVRLPRPGGRKLFPSHRRHGWHRSGKLLPDWAQLVLAGVLLGAVVAARRHGSGPA